MSQVQNPADVMKSRKCKGQMNTDPKVTRLNTDPNDWRNRSYEVRRLDVEATRRCNLNCRMCFIKDALEGRRRVDDNLDMTDETFGNAIHYIRPFVRQKRKLKLTWLGCGEATLRKDWLIQQTIVFRCMFPTNDVVVNMPTNVTVLDDRFIQAWKGMGCGMNASIDGTPEVNKWVRGEFDVEKFEHNARTMIALNYKDVRLTILPETVSELLNGLRYLKGLGFQRIHVLPDWGGNWSEKGLVELIRAMEAAAEWFVDLIRGEEYFNIRIVTDGLSAWKANRPLPQNRVLPCLPTCDSMWRGQGVAADGRILPCHRYSSEWDGTLDNVNDLPIPDASKIFDSLLWELEPLECLKNCVAQPFCHSPCIRDRDGLNGSPSKVQCLFTQTQVRLAREVHQLMADEGNSFYLERIALPHKYDLQLYGTKGAGLCGVSPTTPYYLAVKPIERLGQ